MTFPRPHRAALLTLALIVSLSACKKDDYLSANDQKTDIEFLFEDAMDWAPKTADTTTDDARLVKLTEMARRVRAAVASGRITAEKGQGMMERLRKRMFGSDSDSCEIQLRRRVSTAERSDQMTRQDAGERYRTALAAGVCSAGLPTSDSASGGRSGGG